MTFLFYRGPSALTGTPIVAAVTERSENTKTGNIPTVWILPDQHPVEAARTGRDEAVCGSCPLRPSQRGGCYVPLLHGPAAVFRSQGRAPEVPIAGMWRRLRYSAAVRFCGWGDPAALPIETWEEIRRTRRAASPPILGYTHMWRSRPDLRDVCMASTHSPKEAAEAARAGWRPFLIAPAGARPPRELGGLRTFECPGTDSAPSRRTCAECRACDGRAADDRRAFPWIAVHGNLFAKPRGSAFINAQWAQETE